MAQVFAYTKPNKLSFLNDQLAAAGVAPLRCEGSGDLIWLTYGDQQAKGPVDAVVNAHDASALSPSEVASAQQDADRADFVAQYVAAGARLDAIVTDGPTYAAAQVRDAVVDLARIQRRVLRLVKDARL